MSTHCTMHEIVGKEGHENWHDGETVVRYLVNCGKRATRCRFLVCTDGVVFWNKRGIDEVAYKDSPKLERMMGRGVVEEVRRIMASDSAFPLDAVDKLVHSYHEALNRNECPEDVDLSLDVTFGYEECLYFQRDAIKRALKKAGRDREHLKAALILYNLLVSQFGTWVGSDKDPRG